MARVPVNKPYTITTPFGVPDSNAKFGKHSGIDYAVPLNRPVYAPVSGNLENIKSPTGGNMVVIYDGKYWHRLMHNNSFSRGSGFVNLGDEVAKAGTTGLSTGVHVHWDVNTEGVYPTSFSAFINPDDIIKPEEPMFNEGDAINLSKYFLGHKSPPEVFMKQIGKPWKEALENIMRSNVDLEYVKANEGDNVNVKEAFGFTPESDPNLIGQPWKSVVYNYMLPKIPDAEGNLKPVEGVQYQGKQTYVKD